MNWLIIHYSEGKGGHIPFIEVNIGLLADQVGVPTADTLDFGHGIHDFAFAIDVGVEQTKNVLKVMCLDSVFGLFTRSNALGIAGGARGH